MDEMELQRTVNVAHLSYGAGIAMQGVLLALIRTHPDRAALREAMHQTLAALRSTVQMTNIGLGGKGAQSAEAFENHAERWLKAIDG